MNWEALLPFWQLIFAVAWKTVAIGVGLVAGLVAFVVVIAVLAFLVKTLGFVLQLLWYVLVWVATWPRRAWVKRQANRFQRLEEEIAKAQKAKEPFHAWKEGEERKGAP